MFHDTNVQWSEESFTLHDLSIMNLRFPVLVKVDQGHYGKTTEDTFQPDQKFILLDLESQERVEAKNADGVCISIPVEHDHKFTISSKRGKSSTSAPVSLSTIIKLCRFPVEIMFDKSDRCTFSAGKTKYNSDSFGKIKVSSLHNLEYFCASPIIDGKVHFEKVETIPVNLTITWILAKELGAGLDLKMTMRNVKRDAQRSTGKSVNNRLTGIRGFFDLFPESDRDTRRHTHPPPEAAYSRQRRRSEDQPPVTSSGGTEENVGSSSDRRGLREESVYTSGEQCRAGKEADSQAKAMWKSSTVKERGRMGRRMTEPVSEGLFTPPGIFKRENVLKRPPATYPQVVSSPPRVTYRDRIPFPPSVSSHTGDGHRPPAPLPRTMSSPDADHKQYQSLLKVNTIAHGGNAQTPPVGTAQDRKKMASLSVQDVCECLRLLNLDAYVHRFRAKNIDGSVLATHTEAELQKEFGFSWLTARNLMMLAKGDLASS